MTRKQMMMRVLVTGGRDYRDRTTVFRTLDGLRPCSIVSGGCLTGADMHAERWAHERGVPVQRYRADWTRGRSAGPIRNQMMLDEATPDLVVAFPGGRGTLDMKERARRAGIEVLEIG